MARHCAYQEKTMTYAEMIDKVEELYGEAGVFAVGSSCLTQEDAAKGLDYCINRILPALEEELGAQE